MLFPNPFLTEDLTFADRPDWTRLQLWDHVRKTYLGMPPDDRDRSGRRMMHPYPRVTALVVLLERKGILTKQDVLAMIRELRQREPTAIPPRQYET